MKAFKYLIKKSFKLTFYLLITKPSLIFKYLKWILRGGYFIFGSSFLLAFNIFGLQEYTSYISLLLKNLGINNIFRSINARLIDTYEWISNLGSNEQLTANIREKAKLSCFA